jgi:hypothetical protein
LHITCAQWHAFDFLTEGVSFKWKIQ